MKIMQLGSEMLLETEYASCSATHAMAGSAPRRTRGRLSSKQAPSRTVDTQWRLPPMLRINRRLRANPSPTPGALRAASSADLQNG